MLIPDRHRPRRPAQRSCCGGKLDAAGAGRAHLHLAAQDAAVRPLPSAAVGLGQRPQTDTAAEVVIQIIRWYEAGEGMLGRVNRNTGY